LEPFFRIRVRQLGFACLLGLDIKDKEFVIDFSYNSKFGVASD